VITRATLSAVWALRGQPHESIAPTHVAMPYASAVRGIRRVADLYLPASTTGRSALIVHGGGWVIGSRGMKPVRFLAARLAAAGIATCAIDYRLMFRGGRLAEATADVIEALAWWTARAPDPAGISLLGLSAGATLALLAASASPSVRSLALCFGVYDLDELPGFAARLLTRSGDRAAWRAASPRAARQPVMPTLLLHGDADRLVPAAQAERLAAHRTSLGLPTKLVIYPGAPHGFFSRPGAIADAGAAELITACA
jgi:acetyl esterase/lipase